MNTIYEGIKELFNILENTNIKKKYVKINKGDIIYYFITNLEIVDTIVKKDKNKGIISLDIA